MSNSGSGLPENGTRRDAVLGLLGVVAGVTGVSGAQAAEPAAAAAVAATPSARRRQQLLARAALRRSAKPET